MHTYQIIGEVKSTTEGGSPNSISIFEEFARHTDQAGRRYFNEVAERLKGSYGHLAGFSLKMKLREIREIASIPMD